MVSSWSVDDWQWLIVVKLVIDGTKGISRICKESTIDELVVTDILGIHLVDYCLINDQYVFMDVDMEGTSNKNQFGGSPLW